MSGFELRHTDQGWDSGYETAKEEGVEEIKSGRDETHGSNLQSLAILDFLLLFDEPLPDHAGLGSIAVVGRGRPLGGPNGDVVVHHVV